MSKNPKPWRSFISQEKIDALYKPYEGTRSEEKQQAYSQKLQSAAFEGLAKFIDSENPWKHPFGFQSWILEGCQFTDGYEHPEASILSKALFSGLFAILENEKLHDKKRLVEYFGFDRRFKFEYSDEKMKGKATYGNGLPFHFDQMHNPKPHSEWRVGSMAENVMSDSPLIVPLSFKEYCLTIGNFTPIPWWIARTGETTEKTDKTYDLQTFHKDLAEWWDMLLSYLQWRMDEFADKPSFVDYLILTCQFFYVDGICDQLHTSPNKFADFCKKKDDAKNGWTQYVCDCAGKLREKEENDEIRIISLMSTGQSEISFLDPSKLQTQDKTGKAFKEKYWEPEGKALRNPEIVTPEDICETDRLISRLIEIRGRCIMGVLKENQGLLQEHLYAKRSDENPQ